LSIITRQERKRLVIDLYYNQGKTVREIAKEARMSFRDIGVILNKAVKEKKIEGWKEEIKQEDNAEENQEQQQLSLSTRAYKLFSKGKSPLEVAISLNIRECEVIAVGTSR
jgi:transposase